MIEDTSAGIIPYRTTRDEIQYLVVKGRTKDWEFPKGGIENDEELQQTALRELNEETDISNVKIINGFREDYSYVFEVNNEIIHKTVHLFIGKCFETSVQLSSEHNDYQWRSFEEAKNTLTYSSTTEILKKAHRHINSKSKKALDD